MTIAILCGGSGTRLWPISRSLLPKQFAPLLKEGSFFTQTLQRNQSLELNASFQVITNQDYYFLIQDEAEKLNITIENYILESIGKNTAPALFFSAINALEKSGKDEIILALPSDHLIKNIPAYQESIKKAIDFAEKGFLVTFGIKPTLAHTGYGYIQCENNDVKNFVEKPNVELATKYLKEGNYFWNSGMFCFKASVLLSELKKYDKDLYQKCSLVYENSKKDNNYLRLNPELSVSIPDISIDYALMEKSKKVKCIVATFDWNDVGSFESLCEEWEKDSKGNAFKNEFISKNSQNNFIISDKIVAGIGIEDLMIIDTNDCLLVSKKGESQAIKEIVSELKLSHPQLTQIHTTAHRPWGNYTILLESPNYKIKQLIVKPRSRLSLQKHFHRNEHWIVVSGSAIVTVGEKQIFLKANESTYIPMGEIHRLENPGKINLVMIEVQVGEYLGEDDIIRIEDDFRRC